MSDWSDTGECHNYVQVDTSNGRIYRVSYGEPKQFKGDVAKMTDADLIVAQFSQDEWLVRHARRVVTERSSDPSWPAKVARLRSALDAEFKAVSAGDSATFLKKLWAIHALGGFTDDDIVEMRDRLNPTSSAGTYDSPQMGDLCADTAKAIASLAGVNFQTIAASGPRRGSSPSFRPNSVTHSPWTC